jgi:N-acetylglucosaminyldiphosphoundecaprenol N-acetyl-beta-D-mannosaminyltransferase
MVVSKTNQRLNETAEQVLPLRSAAAPFAGDDFDRDVWSVLGMPVDLATAPEAVLAIEAAARDRRRLSFVTPNVNFLVRAVGDAAARRDILDADLSLVDGAPLVALGRLTGVPVRERCAGSDVFDALRLRPGFPGRRIRVFFFGGRDDAAEAAARAVDREGRGVEAAGFYNPGAGDVQSMSTDAILDTINAANADFVLVALGAAKGQAWISQNRDRLEAPILAHLGAVVDFTAGSIARAPSLWRRFGLEWAWRIKEEPALWRRYWRDGRGLVALLGRALPAALSANWRTGDTGPASASIRRDAGRTIIELAGDLTAANREGLRAALRAAALEGRDAVLDLRGAGRIDASFLGLTLMLEKNLTAQGAAIFLANAPRRHRRLFAAHSMNYAAAVVSAAKTTDAGAVIAAAV